MSYAQRHDVSVTTATGGGVIGYTPVVTGRIAAIVYTSGGASGFASTADFSIQTETTAQTLWSEANVTAGTTVHPVAVAQLPSGADSSLTEVPIYAAQERVQIGIVQGGNTKTGTFTVIVA